MGVGGRTQPFHVLAACAASAGYVYTVFFVYEPGRFRHGPVFGSARGPRSLCVGRNVQAHAAQNTDALFDATAGYGWDCSLITLSGRWGGDISAEAAAISAAFQF